MSQVSVSFDYENHIVLKAMLNDRQAVRLVLDSGADGLYLDSTYFAETGIPAYRRQLATLPGAGSQPQQVMVVLDTIAVNLSGIEFIPRYTPLLHLRPILGQAVDGIIGLSFLRRYIALLDYESKMLSLYDPEQYDPPGGFEAIPMTLRNNRIYIPLEIAITDDVVIKKEFQLDLGNGGTIDITSATADEFNLSDLISEKLHYSNAFGGVGGEIVGNQFRAISVKIGNHKIELPVLDYSEDKSGALSSAEMGGLLGNKILEKFEVIFDFAHQKLHLKPNGNKEAYESTLTGFSYADRRDTDDGLFITGIYENTEAAQLNLAVGDVITELNGKEVADLTLDQIEKLLKKKGSAVQLTIRNSAGSTIKLLKIQGYL
ncbi:MAG: PDZ domain-containing protein [Roseivirga sp.]|nr:PDZ domain-containing protein [Roseivirga sp.]